MGNSPFSKSSSPIDFYIDTIYVKAREDVKGCHQVCNGNKEPLFPRKVKLTRRNSLQFGT